MTLRELREKKAMTQAAVAARVDVQQETVSQLELGKIRDPRVSTLEKLAEAYGVTFKVIRDALNESVHEAEAA